MISKNFLTGLGAIVGITIACALAMIAGFYMMGPIFIFVLFIIAAISLVVSLNYDEIESFGKTIRKIMEERNGN